MARQFSMLIISKSGRKLTNFVGAADRDWKRHRMCLSTKTHYTTINERQYFLVHFLKYWCTREMPRFSLEHVRTAWVKKNRTVDLVTRVFGRFLKMILRWIYWRFITYSWKFYHIRLKSNVFTAICADGMRKGRFTLDFRCVLSFWGSQKLKMLAMSITSNLFLRKLLYPPFRTVKRFKGLR